MSNCFPHGGLLQWLKIWLDILETSQVAHYEDEQYGYLTR